MPSPLFDGIGAPIPLPAPLPSRGLRFVISAAFSSLAIGLTFFFVVGHIVRWAFLPFTWIYDRTNRPKPVRSRVLGPGGTVKRPQPAQQAAWAHYIPPSPGRAPRPPSPTRAASSSLGAPLILVSSCADRPNTPRNYSTSSIISSATSSS